MLGYPIRTPSDHSSVDNSPRTIAASHVLHRLLMPRHPPCALQHFNNKKTQTTKPDTKRCSHPLCNTQHTTTPQPTTTTTTPTHERVRRSGREQPHQENPTNSRCLLRTQQHAEPVLKTENLWTCVPPSHTPPTTQDVESTRRKPTSTTPMSLPPHTGKLLRKEVIQPHLPVRLPCYDFVPIAGPTFDHSPPTRGLGHGLRVLPTFVT